MDSNLPFGGVNATGAAAPSEEAEKLYHYKEMVL